MQPNQRSVSDGPMQTAGPSARHLQQAEGWTVMATTPTKRRGRRAPRTAPPQAVMPLPKCPTGIGGLDEVTAGGLPRGRPTLVCGPAGCGKTLLAMEFLVRGITEFGESGVFVAFEETRDDLVGNVASLGFDLAALEAAGLLVVTHINVVA